MHSFLRRLPILAIVMTLAACGGGGGGGGSPSAPTAPPTVPPANPVPAPPPPAPAPSTIPTLEVHFDGADLRATTPLLAPTAVRDLHADAIAYDRQRDQLLVAAAAPTGGATLLGLAPATLETAWSVALPAAATAMAISDDSSMLYVGLANGTVQQYEAATRRLVREIELTEGRGTVYFPSALTVRPGSPGTVAVSTGSINLLKLMVFHRLAVWQDGVKWPQTLEVGNVLNNESLQVMFADADTLVSLDVQSSIPIMLRIPIQGQLLAPQFPGISICCDGKQLQPYQGHVLVDRGTIVDQATLRVKADPYGQGGVFVPLADAGTLADVALSVVDSAPYQTRIELSEYFSDRFNLKRRAFFDVAPIAPDHSYYPAITRALDAGRGRVALQVDDIAFHKGSKLVVLDSTEIAPTAAPVPVSQSVAVQDVSVLAVTLPLSAMAYDRQRDRVVGVIGPDAGPIGNSLVVIRPADGSIEARFPLSSQPGSVFVSDSGSVAYVTLPEENGFQRVDVGAAGGLGWRVTGLARPVTGLAIAPDDADKVGVILADNIGFRVYRGGAVVSQTNDVYMSDIAFNGAREMVVLDQKTTDNKLSRYAFDGPTAVLTSSQPKPLWQTFGHAEFRGDTMQDGFSYASLASGKRSGWFLRPEGRVMQVPTFPIGIEVYGAVTLWDGSQGFGTNPSYGNKVEFDYLSAQAGAQGGTTDMIGSRRVQITDTRWPQPPIVLGDYRQVIATGPHAGVLARSVGGALNTTLYFVKGL